MRKVIWSREMYWMSSSTVLLNHILNLPELPVSGRGEAISENLGVEDHNYSLEDDMMSTVDSEKEEEEEEEEEEESSSGSDGFQEYY